MKKIVVILSIFSIFACKKTETAPVSDLIKKNWTVKSVSENGASVYVNGASNNIKPGYINFKLNLGEGGNASLTEIDNVNFVGKWEITADNANLTLSNLNPQPTESNGVLTFKILDVSSDGLTLLSNKENLKTGSSINTYELIPK
ncbi:MAG: hypothetical protein U0V04_12150 [Spirosomataceae bacterium]|jgi:hypothetical protein